MFFSWWGVVCGLLSFCFCLSDVLAWHYLFKEKGKACLGKSHADDIWDSREIYLFVWRLQFLISCLFVSHWCKFNLESLSYSSLLPTCFTKFLKQDIFCDGKVESLKRNETGLSFFLFSVSNAMTNAVPQKSK